MITHPLSLNIVTVCIKYEYLVYNFFLYFWVRVAPPYNTNDNTHPRANFSADFLDNGEGVNAKQGRRLNYGNISTRYFQSQPFSLGFEKLGSENRSGVWVTLRVIL